jgi:hypothetical protein
MFQDLTDHKDRTVEVGLLRLALVQPNTGEIVIEAVAGCEKI